MKAVTQSKWMFKAVFLMIAVSVLLPIISYAAKPPPPPPPPVVTLECSSQKEDANLNEVYDLGATNFIEIKIFDPLNTVYSDWSVLYCTDGANIGDCTTSVTVPEMTQSNAYWFYKYGVAYLNKVNQSSKFTLVLVDGNQDLIDMLSFNGATLGPETPINCSFDYPTVNTTSRSKGVMRSPDGTGDWADSDGSGAGTENTPGNSNDLSLVSYYLDECFWDGTPEEVKENIGGYNATAQNGATTSNDAVIGNSALFDGTNQFLKTIDSSTTLQLAADYTASVWIKADATQKPWAGIFSKTNTTGSENHWTLQFDNSASRNIIIYHPTALWNTGIRLGDVAGGWHHIAVTRNGTTMTSYLDGIQKGSGTLGSNPKTGKGHLNIGADRTGTSSYVYKGNIDELKVFYTALKTVDIQRIYANEVAKKNYDSTARVLPICVPAPVPMASSFDVWDTSRNISDRNISTKISAQSFNLTLAALSEENDAYQEFNGTVCTQVVDVADNALSVWSASVFNSSNATTLTHVVNRADRDSRIKIVWKKDDMSGNCPIIGEDNATYSSDNFAIRPNTYNCDAIAASPLISQHAYSSNFVANPFGSTAAVPGYTSSSVFLSANKYMRTGELNSTLSGTIAPASLSFINGSSTVANLSFSDVGEIGVDLNDSSWANVDSDDTLEADRVIHAECRRLFRPDHFKVELTRPLLENNATSFTYLANLAGDVNMSAWARDLNITITAQGEANGTMQNYSDPSSTYYANTVTLSPDLSLPIKHSSATKRVDLAEADSSTLAGFSFIDGVAVYAYGDVAFNYDRSYFDPVAPFIVDGSETYFSLNVQDTLYPAVVGDDNTSSDANATFYYGRLRGNDIATTSSPVSNPIYFEVYDNLNTPYTQGMKQSSLLWYVNDLHAGDGPGNIIEASASSSTLIDAALSGFSFIYPLVSAGIETLGITSSVSQTGMIHLKTQEWLWYVPAGFGSAYDDTPGSDCTMHPCFKYSFTAGSSGLMIQSGDFNGTTVPDENRGDYLKKGVKVFR